MKKLKTKKIRNQADPLSKDLSNLFEKGKWVRFNELFQLQPKNKTITLRVSEDLLKEIKKLAKREDTNYQKLIRDAMIDLVLRKAS
jgi:predicted DNA binding CopG/RHH family protein